MKLTHLPSLEFKKAIVRIFRLFSLGGKARMEKMHSRSVFLSRIHFPVTTLGYGRRIGIWLQGCTIRCPGCVSKDTWNATREHATSIGAILEACSSWLAESDGITVTGGEPFDQPQALSQLLTALRTKIRGDILVYSGYAFEELSERHSSLLAQIDLLISDPFVESAGQSLPLRGSDNQRAWPLTELGQTRYHSLFQKSSAVPKLDLSFDGSIAWMVGITKIGDMKRLRAKLKELGFTCATTIS